MDNVNLENSIPCSGCGACVGLCPKNAIRLELNPSGFFAAAVDADKCVNCGLCLKACPRIGDAKTINLFDIQPLALKSAEKGILLTSASGGAAHQLARLTLEQGAKAVGAVYDTDLDQVVHTVVSDLAELPVLAGSKYLQSDPTEAFSQVLRQRGRYTVFGTPCQITGLARAAEALGIRENLLLVEIFCHGVPSYRLWQEQLQIVRKKLGQGKFDTVRFRDKSQGWHNYRLTIRKDDREFRGSREHAIFWQGFFEDMLLNPACRQCKARLAASAADLRLGDYWGAKFQADTEGVSLVFPVTERGSKAINALLENGSMTALPATDAAGALHYQNMAVYPDSELYAKAQAALAQGQDIPAILRAYRAKQPIKKKLKRLALTASGYLPANLRRKLKELRMK